jgi:hypothetical protein
MGIIIGPAAPVPAAAKCVEAEHPDAFVDRCRCVLLLLALWLLLLP